VLTWRRLIAGGIAAILAGGLFGSAPSGSASVISPSASVADPAAAPALTVEQMAHRLFVVTIAGRRAHHVSDAAAAYNLRNYGVRTPAEVVRRFQPGGVIYFANNISSVDQVRQLSAGLQAAARRDGYRLLIMTDQEGGTVSRLPGIAAEQPSAASYDGHPLPAQREARAVGAAMRRMGVLVDLAPDADVNTAGSASVIGSRSFGSTPGVVSRMLHAQVCGYHSGGVATTLKHWPGLGSVTVDPHQSLPTLTVPVHRWKRVDVTPFRNGIADGTDLVMVTHLAYPALDPTGRPATLSYPLNGAWLRDKLGFRGVVITDSLTMGALRDYGDGARLAVRAYRAGSDLLLMPPTPRAAAHGLVDAIRDGKIDEADVQASVNRVDHLLDKLGLVPGPATLPGC